MVMIFAAALLYPAAILVGEYLKLKLDELTHSPATTSSLAAYERRGGREATGTLSTGIPP